MAFIARLASKLRRQTLTEGYMKDISTHRHGHEGNEPERHFSNGMDHPGSVRGWRDVRGSLKRAATP